MSSSLVSPQPSSPSAEGNHTNFLTRRRWLKWASAAGIGLWAASHPESVRAFLPNMNLDDLVQRHLKTVYPLPGAPKYMAFLKSLEIRRTPISKLIGAHVRKRNGVSNCLPPEKLWEKMSPTLKAVDAIADHLGEDVLQINSAYRSPEYNAKCPGSAKNSQHIHNCALDLVFKAAPKDVAAAARQLRAKGVFRGGVGLYGTFTHIDTRGHNADWQV